jgi:hypothetical protein
MIALMMDLMREIRDEEVLDCETGMMWDGLAREEMRLALPIPLTPHVTEGSDTF